MAEVKIGDSTATVSKLNGFKAAEAIGIISEITEVAPTLLSEIAEFTRQYESDHAQRMPRAAAESRYPQSKDVSEEAWQASGNELVIPTAPGVEEQIAFALPKVYKQARTSLVDLFSLMIAPNSELKQVDEDGADLYGKDGALAEYRSRVLHDADLEQLVDLAGAVADVLKDQLSSIDAGGQMGKLAEVMGLRRVPTTPSTSPEPSAPSGSEPASSSPSDGGSTGPATPSSSTPPSERSEPQPVS